MATGRPHPCSAFISMRVPLILLFLLLCTSKAFAVGVIICDRAGPRCGSASDMPTEGDALSSAYKKCHQTTGYYCNASLARYFTDRCGSASASPTDVFFGDGVTLDEATSSSQRSCSTFSSGPCKVMEAVCDHLPFPSHSDPKISAQSPAVGSAAMYVSVACGRTANDPIVCVLAEGKVAKDEQIPPITAEALRKCQQAGILDCRFYSGYSGSCHGIAATPDGRVNEVFGPSIEDARIGAFNACNARYQTTCHGVIAFCASAANSTGPIAASAPQEDGDHEFDFLSDPKFYRALFIAKVVEDIRTGIGIGLGILVVILLFAKRTAVINFVVHGRLPYKLPVYGEDIQCLIKRTQRVNWYGRVIFGAVANLSMTHDQLIDVRKYWLGRVIAFDSLRRQRQNQLARMHLQLATAAVPEAKGKTALRQLWTALKYIFFVIFYLVRALFSFLFGFLFIRITIAKLVRGTIIESRDLVLILQAKDAIEQSANYLKEYLAMANTFDGRDEVYEPE